MELNLSTLLLLLLLLLLLYYYYYYYYYYCCYTFASFVFDRLLERSDVLERHQEQHNDVFLVSYWSDV